MGLDLAEMIVEDYQEIINKGALVEVYTALELVSAGPFHKRPELFYWHREKRASNAEVDYVISNKGKIIPIEVKTGTKGQMQSMHLFLSERANHFGLRISAENFNQYDKIFTLPVYAVWNIYHYSDFYQ